MSGQKEEARAQVLEWCSRACREFTWTYDDKARAYYFHRFYEFQPDLSTSHPEVQAELLKIMGFWIQLGVSGCMDAVPFVIGTKGPRFASRRAAYDMLRSFREFLQWRQGGCIAAEANVLPETDMGTSATTTACT
jgi:maltose alpha-D-glucosyltransferase/alpha-amylase